jgi:2-succinyl-5-enolpyruvyl-6-hydroxy-3-cyclohexene-1-carboxylate synthase
VFGTPHHVDLAALCAGYGVAHTLVADEKQLCLALRPASHADIRVQEYRASRTSLRPLHLRLRTAITEAVPAALA